MNNKLPATRLKRTALGTVFRRTVPIRLAVGPGFPRERAHKPLTVLNLGALRKPPEERVTFAAIVPCYHRAVEQDRGRQPSPLSRFAAVEVAVERSAKRQAACGRARKLIPDSGTDCVNPLVLVS